MEVKFWYNVILLVSYDKDSGLKWFGLIDKLKEVPPVTKEVKDGFSKIFEIKANDKLSSYVGHFDDLANICNVTDKNFIGFLETTQKSGTVYNNAEDAIAGYQTYLKTTSNTLTIANIKTKALSVTMKALSSIGWMALITAATWAIGKLFEGIEYLATASERAKEAASELSDELQNQKDTIEGNITTIEGLKSEFKKLSKY